MTGDQRFYEAPASGDGRRSAPAALRNREPIADVLAEWLPESGVVLEVASGTGEHAVYFAERFPQLEWQPTDVHSDAVDSIRGWRNHSGGRNVREPIILDAASPEWPVERADAVLSINMVHISSWESTLGLVDGSARVLPASGPLILYGPWLIDSIDTAASNIAFDKDLRRRDSRWGLRRVDQFAAAAEARGFEFVEHRLMPANNLMLLFRKRREAEN